MSDYLSYVTRNKGDSIKDKSRIFFTSQQDDFKKYFYQIINDIFAISDAAIFYTEDMNQEIKEEDANIDLLAMSLFIIPVTEKLLTSQTRTINSDLKFALDHHIPVLPIVLEEGLDKEYTSVFHNIQYLKKISRDNTERAYSLKLEDYLNKILVQDDTIKKINEVFKYSVFISYRKKDRAKAQKLMEIIHQNDATE